MIETIYKRSKNHFEDHIELNPQINDWTKSWIANIQPIEQIKSNSYINLFFLFRIPKFDFLLSSDKFVTHST